MQARLRRRRSQRRAPAPPLPIPDGPPFAIVHSPLGRARRSAELVVDALAAAGRAAPPLRADAGFSEIAQGGWEGLTDREITARFGDQLAGWRRWPTRFHAQGGESLEEVAARVEPALRHPGRDGRRPEAGTQDRHQVLGYGEAGPERAWSLIVGHGGVFRVVVCDLLGLPLENFWNFDFGLARSPWSRSGPAAQCFGCPEPRLAPRRPNRGQQSRRSSRRNDSGAL